MLFTTVFYAATLSLSTLALAKGETGTAELQVRQYDYDLEEREIDFDLEDRDYDDWDLEGRDFDQFDDFDARDYDEDLELRDYDDGLDLDAREYDEMEERDVEELTERESSNEISVLGVRFFYDDIDVRHFDEIIERGFEEDSDLMVRAPKPPPAKKPAPPPAKKAAPAAPKKPAPKVVQFDPNTDPRTQANKANYAPGRQKPQFCKKANDCTCNNPKDGKTHTTACFKGQCKCDSKEINFFGDQLIDVAKQIGNSKVIKIVGEFYKGIADIKQVVSIVAGAFLGPEAKAALKVALLAMPDVGPSHLDDATKGIINKLA